MFILTDQIKSAKARSVIMVLAASAILPIAASSIRAVVTEAGADPAGRADSTPAIQKCIDDVSAAGGGTVVVPPGEYLISFLTLRPHVRLELAGGAERATDGWTPEVAARAMDPARSAIIRSVPDRKGRWSIFLYNLVPPTAATNGLSDVVVSGGVFDCQARCVVAAFACGRNIRFENAVVKDIPNNHALQIDGCENVVVTNCLFAGYTFGGKQTCLTRETVQVEQTSPGAIGNPETAPISCAKEISIPNRNVSVAGCWFGPSERLGPHLIPLGHHGRVRSCNGLVFAGNVVVNPLYCGVRLANVSDARVEDNTFISTNTSRRLASDSAVVCVWGDAALQPGEKGVVLRGNKVILSARSPLRKMWVSTPRHQEVSSADGASERFASAWETRRGEPYRESPVAPPVFNGHPRFSRTYSHTIITFALRVFHNAEADKYALANAKIVENCRFYIENTDVRNDRDSFYWNIGELCRAVLHYGAKGDIAPRRLSPEAESVFREMAFDYCHDISKLDDADSDGVKTWRVYESENHHVQRASALWQLMHVLLKSDPAYGARKLADGGTLRAHYAAWEDFFCTWMRERAKRSMFIEVQSRGYGIHTIKNIYPLYDFSDRPATRRLAKNFIDLFWALWAQEQIDGASGGGMSRVYTTGARGTFSETAVWAYWYFGLNAFVDRVPNGMDYVCLDSAYRPHPIIGKIAASAAARGVYEIAMRPLGWTLPSNKYPDYRPDPDWGRIYRYTYATPDFIVGTQMFPQAPCDKWCMISSQNRFHGVVYGPYDAQLLPIPEATGKHTKTATIASVAYNSFWSMQKRGTLLTRKNKYASRTGRMYVWFSAAGDVDKVEKDGDWWFTKCGGAYSAVRVAKGGARLAVAGPKAEIPCERAGKFLVCDDQWTPVIVETARACDFKDEAAFRAKVKATAFALTPSALDYTGIYGNRFHMLLNADDGSTIDGEPYVKKIDWSICSPFVKIPWLGDTAELTFGGETVRLEFGLTM